MTPGHGFRRLLRIRPGRTEVDLELEFHIESRIDDLVQEGVTPEEARTRALREFGDLAGTERILRASRRRLVSRRARADWQSDLRLDTRIAWRGLIRRPGLTATLLLILGIASGAAGAIFTVVRASLVAALPYPEPGRLVDVSETKGQGERGEASWPDYIDWKAQTAGTFTGLEGYEPANVFVSGAFGTNMLRAARVTAGFFDLLGSRPTLGRVFQSGEDRPGGTDVVVISHGHWQRAFGSNPGILDTIISINGRPHAVIGVLPNGFHFAAVGDAELWLPLDRSAATRSQRSDHWLHVVGRLSDETSVASAGGALDVVMQRLAAAYPETNRGRSGRVVPLRDIVIGDLRPVLVVLSLAVGLMLFIACANAAGLLLSRVLARHRELAVRMAIGATRGRVLRQLVTESLLAGFGGALIGTVVARAGVSYLVGGLNDGAMDHLPFLRDLRPDAATVLFLAALAIVTGLGAGLVPALVGARSRANDAITGGPRTTTGRHGGWLRDGLVVGQIALTLSLLAGTALMGRSLMQLLAQDLGFRAEELLTGRVALSGPSWQDGAGVRRFFDALLERVRLVPGVRSVGAVNALPLSPGGTNTFRVEGEPEPDQAARPEATSRAVAGDYFHTMGIPLIAGRTFTSRDDSTTQPVLVISQSLAHRWFPGGHAIGRRVRFYAFPDTTWEVIGLVGDVTVGRIDGVLPAINYFTHLQWAQNRMSLAVRASGPAGLITRAIRADLNAQGTGVVLYAEAPMTSVVAESPAVVARRYPLRVIAAFAAAALLLAVAGVYGVVANGVVERRRELGIRAALGASRAGLVGLILRRGTTVVALGSVSGVLLALAFGRAMRSMLYLVPANDPLMLGAAMGLLAGAALLASWWPARRAGRVDPVEALREE